jgi:ubiquinone/menaquinone biosynthesis C-methylase UbiE
VDPLQIPDAQTQRAETTKAYDRLAEVWDETDDNLWNEALERKAVRELLPGSLIGNTVLDAGCASGAHSEWLARRGCNVVGFDLSTAMIAAARDRCSTSARLLIADLAERLPFTDDAFDGVLCSLALHYLEDIAAPLLEFSRVVRMGGWVSVTLDHPAADSLESPRSDYFVTRMLSDTWSKNGITVTQRFWRRPLGDVVDAFADAGLLIERIGESKLDDEARRRFPEEASTIEGVPTFIAYRAVPDPR